VAVTYRNRFNGQDETVPAGRIARRRGLDSYEFLAWIDGHPLGTYGTLAHARRAVVQAWLKTHGKLVEA